MQAYTGDPISLFESTTPVVKDNWFAKRSQSVQPSQSKPPLEQLNLLPLSQKLILIQEHELDPTSTLTKAELKLAGVQEELSIPSDINNLELKNLLHKQAKKVNKWIMHGLRGFTKQDFDGFMKNDKSFIDKKSLQYKRIEEE